MSGKRFTKDDWETLGRLANLMDVLAFAAKGLDNVSDGSFRDHLTFSLGDSCELAGRVACDLSAKLEPYVVRGDFK